MLNRLRTPILAVGCAFLVGCGDVPDAVIAPPDGGLGPGVVLPSHNPAAGAATQVWRVRLDPLNDSGVRGSATLAVRGEELVVTLNAVGHAPDRTHAQHIHGFDQAESTCPTADADGGDGVLSIGDGLPFYGPVQLPLQPFPAPANRAGAIHYRASFALADLAFTAAELERKTVVLHGDFVDGTYVGSLPVACGTVEPVH